MTFVVPLAFFLFLASGRVHFEKLPILVDQPQFSPQNELELFNLKDKVSVVAFVGKQPDVNKIQEILNLYQVVYKKTEKFKLFQLVLVFTNDFEGKAMVTRELNYVGARDLPKFKIANWSTAQIATFFDSYKLNDLMSEKLESNLAFIIDTKGRLRGRVEESNGIYSQYKGYLMTEVADLRNKMYDDLQVLFYELKFSKNQD